MKIIIVGGGKVGHQIGKKLTNEKHDVVIIDDDPDVLARISDEMDVFCVEGNGADYKVQSEAGAGSADVLIAATAHDEINMLAALLHINWAQSTRSPAFATRNTPFSWTF